MNQDSNIRFWLKLKLAIALTLLTIAFMTKSYRIGYRDGIRDAGLALTNNPARHP